MSVLHVFVHMCECTYTCERVACVCYTCVSAPTLVSVLHVFVHMCECTYTCERAACVCTHV